MIGSRSQAVPAGERGTEARRHRLGAFAAGFFALLGLLGVPGAASAQLRTDPGKVLQTIYTSLWTPPSPDPAGITYLPESGELVTCDSEVDEIPSLFTGVNVWFHSNTGAVHSTTTTFPVPAENYFSNEPAGIAFDPAGGRAWVADDNGARIYQVELGADGIFGTADDFVADLDGVATAGCDDVEDVTYDSLDGHLYIASGETQKICEIAPGPDGEFTGAAPTGDDIVTTFSVAPYIVDAEGIVYDPFWNTLVVADRKGNRDLYELTPEGVVLRRIDVNFPPGSRPSGVTIAPGSTNPLLRNYWVTDRRLDNVEPNLDENDGRIYEVVAIPLGGNGAPVVEAGSPQSIEWPANSVELDGFVSDDGHPYPPSTVLTLWSQLAGPGSVSFTDSSSSTTTATFSAPGEYVLQLLGDDSAAQATDTVAISVTHTGTVSVTTQGPGSVTLDPPGGTYAAGTPVVVEAAPEAGAVFEGFSGSLTGTDSPQVLMVDGDEAVTATFEPVAAFDLDIWSQGSGTVSLDPAAGPYADGTPVTLTAVPSSGSVFDGWSGDATGSSNPVLVVMDADKSVQATFKQTGGGFATSCGIGPELVAAVPLLAWLHGRRRRQPTVPPAQLGGREVLGQ